MAYELTAAAASSANPYAIAIAAAIDTARAAATQTQTQTGQKITQRKLSGQGFGDILSQIIKTFYWNLSNCNCSNCRNFTTNFKD